MLTTKLTIEQQEDLLSTLFGFCFYDKLLIDDDGQEFYAHPENSQFDFSTLAGIFSYTAHRAKNQGYSDAQFNIRKSLGV